MKYTFTINQAAAVELGDVSLVECAIIEWIRDMCVSQNPRIASHRVKGHTWISYQYAIDDMPLLGLNSKEAFRYHIQGLLQKGYITAHRENQKIYVKPTPKMERLFYSPEPAGNRQNNLTAPSKPLDGSGQRRTAVNRQNVLTNSYSDTKTQGNDPKEGKSAAPAALKISRFDEPKPRASRETVEKMRANLAAKGIVRPVQSADILRHSQTDGANSVEPHTDTNLLDKPVKRAVKTRRRADATRHPVKQLATAQT